MTWDEEMNQTMKLEQNDALKRSSRVPAWLVMAFCIIGTIATLYLTGFIPGRNAVAASNAAATEKPEEVYLAYTVNNLGYTATCG
ncbi:MAG TPA: hypothetical protein DD471_09825 [Planctomycetes bacterium]|nr:hypothetical protein [Planctomycetota bacterium]